MDHRGTYRAPGQTVGGGRYRLDRLEPAATAPQVAVWSSVDTWSARPVRLHLVSPSAHVPPTEHAGWLERATHDARRFGQLSTHPSLLVLRDAGQDGGQLWTVTDSTSTRSLGDTVRAAGPVPPDQLRAMLRGLFDGLRAVHDLGMVHGALTPESVLLTGDGRTVIACAGLPADAVPAAASTSTPARVLAYQAPERLAGGPGDQAADVFSLGAVAYFAAEGRGPFDRGDDVAATRYSVMYQPLAPPERAGETAGSIMAMLAQQPKARPTAAGALALLAAPPASAGPAGYGTSAAGSGPTDAGTTTVYGGPPGHNGPPGYGGPTGYGGGGYSGQPGPYPPGAAQQRAKPSRAPWYIAAAVAVLLLAGAVTGLVLTSGESSSAPNAAGGSPTEGARPSSAPSPSPSSPSPSSPSPSRSRPPIPSRTPNQPPGPGADDYDPALRRAFLESCTTASGGASDVCECVLDEFETRYSQEEFVELNLDPDSPEAQEAVASVLVLCSSTTDA